MTIELSTSEAEALQEKAARMGLKVEELAHAAITDLVARAESEFETVAARVLERNAELYRRLA